MITTPELGALGDEHDRSQDLELESDAIRADLDHTLHAIERKFSPKQLLDRSLNYMQANGGDILQKIGATVNRNPIPLLLTSAGLIWLVASRRRSNRTAVSSWTGSQDLENAAEPSIETRTGRAAARLKDTATKTLDATRQRTANLGRSVNGLIEEQPLICGAMAVAVGAAIGAAFPATQYERAWADRARNAGESLLDDLQTQRESSDSSVGSQSLSH